MIKLKCSGFFLSTPSGILPVLAGVTCKLWNFTHLSVTLWTITYVILKFSKVYSYSMVFFSKWAVCLVTCFDVVCNWRVIPALPLLLNATTFYTHQPPSKIVYLTYMTYFFLWMTFEIGLSSFFFFFCWEISFLVVVPSFLLLCRYLLLLNVLYVKLVWHILLFCELRGSAYGWVFFGLWK